MTDIFDKRYIFLHEDLKSQDDAFRFIANTAVNLGFGDDEVAILKALKDREAQASTGLQDGIAIPHAITSHITRPAVLFIRSHSPIMDWETLDDVPVKQIIVMLVPKGEEDEHLQVLADFAGALVDDDKREALGTSKTVDQVYSLLTATN